MEKDKQFDHNRQMTRSAFLRDYGLVATVGLATACGSEPEQIAADNSAGTDGFESFFTRVNVAIAGTQPGDQFFAPNAPLIIGRDPDGYYAMSSFCSHARCDIRKEGDFTPTGIVCHCHDSTFDPTGQVQTGPAKKALSHYRTERVGADTLMVEIGNIVAPDTRTI